MPYLAGPNGLQGLTNALTGVAAGTKDFAQLKIKRDSLRQDQAQHSDRMSMALHQLDTQIEQADLDRTQRAELEQARNELNAKLTREGYVSSQKIATTQASVGHGRTAERRRQFNYLQTQAAQQDNAIAGFVNALPPLPGVTEIPQGLQAGEATKESMAELERLTRIANDNDRKRNEVIAEQTERLAIELAGPPGQPITNSIRKQAEAVIRDREGFNRRVYVRAQKLALARKGQLAGGPLSGATQAAGGYETPYGFVSSAAGEFPQFQVPYMNKQVGRSEDGGIVVTKEAMESVYADTKSPAGQQRINEYKAANVRLFTAEKLDDTALASNFEVALLDMDPERQTYARIAFTEWMDQYANYEGRAKNKVVTEIDAASFDSAGKKLDYAMGNRDGQMVKAAQIVMQYARTAKNTMNPQGQSVGEWVGGTANAADIAADTSPAQLLRESYEAQQTRADPEYDYEDDLISAWDHTNTLPGRAPTIGEMDAAMGLMSGIAARPGDRPAETTEQMMGEALSGLRLRAGRGPTASFSGEEWVGDYGPGRAGVKEFFINPGTGERQESGAQTRQNWQAALLERIKTQEDLEAYLLKEGWKYPEMRKAFGMEK